LNILLTCCPIVFCMVLWVVNCRVCVCVCVVLAKHDNWSVKV
jgi:hypothetical protein